MLCGAGAGVADRGARLMREDHALRAARDAGEVGALEPLGDRARGFELKGGGVLVVLWLRRGEPVAEAYPDELFLVVLFDGDDGAARAKVDGDLSCLEVSARVSRFPSGVGGEL